MGVAYPKSQPMRMYGSLWNADDWATRGGLVKTNWSEGPFVASFMNYNSENACIWSIDNGTTTNTPCSPSGSSSSSSTSTSEWFSQRGMDSSSRKVLKWVQKKFMVYNYCKDKKRFWQGLPVECGAKKNNKNKNKNKNIKSWNSSQFFKNDLMSLRCWLLLWSFVVFMLCGKWWNENFFDEFLVLKVKRGKVCGWNLLAFRSFFHLKGWKCCRQTFSFYYKKMKEKKIILLLLCMQSALHWKIDNLMHDI